MASAIQRVRLSGFLSSVIASFFAMTTGLCIANTGMNRPPQAPIDIMATADVHDFTDRWTGSRIYPSQAGLPGWPGTQPALPGRGTYGFPERIPYPGSVEHVRVYTQRYLPVVPVYNEKTLVRNFPAVELPGIARDRIVEYAEPIYYVPKYDSAINTGLKNRPVKVLAWTKSDPPMALDLGDLGQGVYAVRLIAATPTENVGRSPKRLVLNFEVNDGPAGETNRYRKRCAAIDEFYSIVEFFIILPQPRRCQVKLWVDESTVLPLLLVHNIDVHDRLAPLARRAGKKSASHYDAAARLAAWQKAGTHKPDARPRTERLAEDEKLWNTCMRVNAQPITGESENWDAFNRSAFALIPDGVKDDGMGLDFYGQDMLWNRSQEFLTPLKDGWVVPRTLLIGPKSGATRHTAYAAAYELSRSYRVPFEAVGDAKRYHQTGNEIQARRAAILLARLGLQNVTHNCRQGINVYDLIPQFLHGDTAFRGRYMEMDYGLRGAWGDSVDEFGQVNSFVTSYDYLFPYILGNQDLADSLGRFIPWIKTPADVARFYDTFILQYYAHQVMTYNAFLDSPTPSWMANVMAIQQDPEITRPWADWLFRYVWVYPNIPLGVDEIAVNAVGRDGGDRKGSTTYSLGGSFLPGLLNDLRIYTAGGGKLPLDMTDPVKFPKAEWSRRFQEQVGVAGGYSFLVGDVGGPNRPRLHDYRGKPDAKAPTNPSRVLADWFGVMESGLESEDFRFRRAAGVRVGYGTGHHHDDPLDLQIWAHGVPMCGDGGGRTGYATPANAAVQSHNTVVSPLAMETSHRWISSFAPAPGAQYLEARVKCGGFYGRQLALIDADAGRPAETTNAWPVTPNSYVVDVFRVRGGDKAPSYAFHGPPPDEFTVNAPDKRKADFGGFIDPESKWEGTASDTLTAQWRMRRDPAEIVYRDNSGAEKKFGVPGAERMAMNEARLGAALTDAVPRKHIRMRLLGHKGARTWGARAFCPNGEPFMNENLYVTPAAWGGETVFPVVFEPFAGPADGGFIAGIKLLTPASSLTNAAAPVAVEVTLKNGRRDVIVMAPRGSGPATIPGVGTVDGEYAFLSWDGKGLRQAALAGGTVIETSELKLKAERAAYEGTVKAADYYAKTAVFDAPLPASAAGAVIEIGPPSRHTSYTIEKANGATVQFDKGMDFAMGRVREFLPEGAPVLQSPIERVEGLTVSDDSFRNGWRVGPPVQPEGQETGLSAAAGGGAHPAEMKPWELAINLVGDKPAKDVLKPGSVVRLWEFGPGDAWRLPATVRVDRKADGAYEGKANVAATVEVRGEKIDLRP